jgi:alcohol dehydrogenase class IV
VSFLSLVLVVGHAPAFTLGLHINIIHCEPISILVRTVQQFSEVSWAIKITYAVRLFFAPLARSCRCLQKVSEISNRLGSAYLSR